MRKRTFWILAGIAVLPVVLAGFARKHEAQRDYDPLHHIGEPPAYVDLATGEVHMGGGEEAPLPLVSPTFFFLRAIMTWIVFGLILLFAHRATKRFSEVPSRTQSIGELLVGSFDSLTKDTLGVRARQYFPLITTFFIFILVSNWIGVLPKVWEYLGVYIGSIVALFDPNVHVVGRFLYWFIEVPDGHWLSFISAIPPVEEPTIDVNATLGCGLIALVTAHAAGIKHTGFKKYFMNTYCDLDIPVVKYFPGIPMAIVMEFIGKPVSHSFRLLGNILGGAIVILVVVSLLERAWYFLPSGVFLRVGLDLFLGLFIGLVQAFVFAMLAMVYIAIKLPAEE